MHRNYRHIEFILANVPVRCNGISKLYVYYSYLLCNLFFSFLNGEQMIDKGIWGDLFSKRLAWVYYHDKWNT